MRNYEIKMLIDAVTLCQRARKEILVAKIYRDNTEWCALIYQVYIDSKIANCRWLLCWLMTKIASVYFSCVTKANNFSFCAVFPFTTFHWFHYYMPQESPKVGNRYKNRSKKCVAYCFYNSLISPSRQLSTHRYIVAFFCDGRILQQSLLGDCKTSFLTVSDMIVIAST